jgi:hypothetical protein
MRSADKASAATAEKLFTAVGIDPTTYGRRRRMIPQPAADKRDHRKQQQELCQDGSF